MFYWNNELFDVLGKLGFSIRFVFIWFDLVAKGNFKMSLFFFVWDFLFFFDVILVKGKRKYLVCYLGRELFCYFEFLGIIEMLLWGI